MTANNIDNAIARLQALALLCTIPNAGVTSTHLKAAPTYPIEDAAALPIAIAHLSSGNVQVPDSSSAKIFPTVAVDFHFSRISFKLAYTQIDAVAQEYSQRLAGDPTLAGAVTTIVFPVNFTIGPAQWDKVTTQMLTFTIPLKILQTPI